MQDKRLFKQDLERMKNKRNNICIELGNGYDWILLDSLIAIDVKIKNMENKLFELENS